MNRPIIEVSYFPGCSLATSARESNESLIKACEFMGLKLVELEDWNCCGSSSAHSLDHKLALGLAARNLSLADPERPLMIMCPSCYRNQLSARVTLTKNPAQRRSWERRWGGEISPELKIVSFTEILRFLDRLRAMGAAPALEQKVDLAGLKVAVYLGCMGMFPPSLRAQRSNAEPLEDQLAAYGAKPVTWAYKNKCCGTFLSVARPDVVGPMVDRIMDNAIRSGADCLVTACAMCQLNLEIRCGLEQKLPILHFSEVAALVLGARDTEPWFARHLVDPRPLLRDKGLV